MMKLYLFIILACIGLLLGGKQVVSNMQMGTSHDAIAGAAMFLFSLFSILAVTVNSKKQARGK